MNDLSSFDVISLFIKCSSAYDVSIAAPDHRVHAGAVDLLHPADQESVWDPQCGHLK